MKNCIILGSGRSGTSLMGGILSDSAYYMGSNLIPADEANPKGYFEDLEINRLNEDILDKILPKRPVGWIGNVFYSRRLAYWQRWLATVKANIKLQTNSDINTRIQQFTKQQPFCYKDPRFSFTLPLWQPFLQNTTFICVFRNPSHTAYSMVKEAQRDAETRKMTLKFDTQSAFNNWASIYIHVLQHVQNSPKDWIFVHYEQLLNGSILNKIETILQTTVKKDFAEVQYQRSNKSAIEMPVGIKKLYNELCRKANYSL